MLEGYYFITDAALSRSGSASDVKNAVAAGVTVVQHRNKIAGIKVLLEEAGRLRSLCRKALFLINDRVDVALAVGADGVHLGNEDMPYAQARKLLGSHRIIGLTAHTLSEARAAQKLGADYVGVSPIFATETKSDAGKACGVGLIRRVRRYVTVPIVAIGGITLDNAPAVIAAGADCICAISSVVTKPDVSREIGKFQALFKR